MSTKVAELTVDEFRQVIENTVEQKLLEMFGDPDEGLELSEDIKVRLKRARAEKEAGRVITAQEVAAQLGLEW
ncbi:MAG: hypothetical protein PVF47_10900 [Anaerolineae bacterium]